MERIAVDRIPRGGPILVMRGGFALLAQTLADLGCLAVLRWLLRREGKDLGDLLNLDRRQMKGDVLRGLGDVAALGLAAGASSALQRPFYPAGLPPQITIVRDLPR